MEPIGTQRLSTPLAVQPEPDFVAHVRVMAGMASSEQARRAVRAVLEVLGEHLPDGWAHLVAAELAPEVGNPLRHASRRDRAGGQRDPAGFFIAVGERAAVTPERAARLTQVVLTVLEYTIDPALLRRVYGALIAPGTTWADRTIRRG
jgi:uncharacterized protein (DUF2267 family)